MGGEISTVTKTEVLEAIRNRYAGASKRDKSRMLDEFVALTGCHRKHAVRLLNRDGQESTKRTVTRGKRIYDEAVRQALIVVWEASDRICGKRLKAALHSMVESLERHGHLDLDPDVRERLFSASASTMDGLLRPVREQAGSRVLRDTVTPSSVEERKEESRATGLQAGPGHRRSQWAAVAGDPGTGRRARLITAVSRKSYPYHERTSLPLSRFCLSGRATRCATDRSSETFRRPFDLEPYWAGG